MSSQTPYVFHRPELLDNQSRLILSAHVKPKRLQLGARHSASITAARHGSAAAMTSAFAQDSDSDDDAMALPVAKPVNYDTDIEQEDEPRKDYSCRGLYLEQCRRHGVVPSSHFLRHIDDKTMTIRYCGLKPVNIKVMIPSLRTNTNVTTLDLRDNGLGSSGALYIAQLIADNEYIVELNLGDNDIGLQGCIALCSVLRTNRTIRTLHLDGNRFDDECAPYFAEVLSHNDYIKCLSLNKNCFENDKTGRLLGQALADNQTVEQFYLAWNRLRSSSCAILLKSLAANARLNTLDLSWNGAGVLAAKAIGDFLKANSTLETLRLDSNQLNTECAVYIGEGLAANEALKLLTLNGNPLEASGCYALLSPLVKHSTSQLQTIDLRGIVVSRDLVDLVKQLAAALPRLMVKLGKERERAV